MLLDDEELRKKLRWLDKEYGQRGYSAGKGPPDMYGRQTTTGEEGWKDVIGDQLRMNQFGPDLPRGLGLLESREQAEQVLGHRLVDEEAPPLKQVPLMKDMLNTSGVPYWDDPETAGSKIPFPEQNPAGNLSWAQTDALYDQGQSNYYGPSGNQNRISPLPHQLEGPETSTGPMVRSPMGYDVRFDPNQELYDPNYYGTAGQMGQMGPPLSPGEGMGMGIMSDAHPFSQGMPGGEMPGLLDSGEGQFSQAFPGSDPNEDWQKQGWDNQPASLLAETGEGGKWEKTPEGDDSIYRRNRRLQGYKGIMDLGARLTGGPTRWR